MAGMVDTTLVEGLLVQGQRRDAVDAARQCEVDGRRQEVERGAAGSRVDRARLNAGEIAMFALDGQAGDDVAGRLGVFGRGDDLDPDRSRRVRPVRVARAITAGSPITSGRARA